MHKQEKNPFLETDPGMTEITEKAGKDVRAPAKRIPYAQGFKGKHEQNGRENEPNESQQGCNVPYLERTFHRPLSAGEIRVSRSLGKHHPLALAHRVTA